MPALTSTDQLLEPVDDGDRSGGVDPAEVAGVQPAVPIREIHDAVVAHHQATGLDVPGPRRLRQRRFRRRVAVGAQPSSPVRRC